MYFDSLLIAEEFDYTILSQAIYAGINAELTHLGIPELQVDSVLQKAAFDYALFQADAEEYKTGMGGKKQSLEYRMQSHGGAAKSCVEIGMKLAASKGRTNLSYNNIAEEFVFKIFNGKEVDYVKSENYRFMGVASALDETGKKAYFTLILGNYPVHNHNKSAVLNSGMNISTKVKLLPYDSKMCKKVDKLKNVQDLQQYLKVEDNRIFFDTDDYKLLKKIIKEPKDGFGVDIIQRSQYPCEGINLVDNSLPTKGLLLNPIYQPKLEKLNLYEGKDAKNSLRVELGAVPPGFDDFELNLLLIQNKFACMDIPKSYIEGGEVETGLSGGILADTIIVYNTFNYHYKPEPDTTYLSFKIPFELGKASYNKADIQGFIRALDEPDFIVKKLKITAFSSIEGTEETNVKLREARAQSIIDAFKTMQSGDIQTEVITSDSWDMFYTDIKGSAWDSLTKYKKEEIRQIIQEKKLEKELDPILSKHRFAKIDMEVIYDISGMKEQAFVVKKFHKAIDTGDVVEALAIQKYMMKNVRRGRYPKRIIDSVHIPKDSARFAGMQMNWLWLDYMANSKPIDDIFYNEVLRLLKLDKSNDYIVYNKVYCDILLDTITDESEIYEVQRQIEALLTSSLRRENVDPLNLQFQIKVLTSLNETFESKNENALVQEVVDRIKGIIAVNESDVDGALNLANLFIQMKDYSYAASILEPFLVNEDISNEILYTYLSVCSKIKDKHLTRNFERAFFLASLKDKSVFCDLVSDNKFSFQILENPQVKSMYCNTCK